MSVFIPSFHHDAQQAKLDSESIKKLWEDYLHGRTRRAHLLTTPAPAEISELLELLSVALGKIVKEQHDETQLITHLDALTHDEKIRRVKKLEYCLGYAKTKHQHIHTLLEQLRDTLTTQLYLATILLRGAQDAAKITAHLKSQFAIELEIGEQISRRPKFHTLLTSLATGEHLIATLSAREERLHAIVNKGFAKIFSGDLTQGIVHSWASEVLNSLEDEIHEAIANNTLSAYHPDAEFEYVNHPEFAALVRKTIARLRPRPVSENTINVFIHLFRKWFNEREH